MRIKISLILWSVGFAVACGSPNTGSADGASAEADAGPDCSGSTFLAVQGDFANFTSWTSFDTGETMTDNVQVVGDRVVYLNHVPPHGSTSFPVGTILVKAINWNTPDAGQTFAMVKRGGCFNQAGATGWEWYELTPGANGDGNAPIFLWQGVAPPTNEAYANLQSCNSCHTSSSTNDFVPSSQLSLSNF